MSELRNLYMQSMIYFKGYLFVKHGMSYKVIDDFIDRVPARAINDANVRFNTYLKPIPVDGRKWQVDSFTCEIDADYIDELVEKYGKFSDKTTTEENRV